MTIQQKLNLWISLLEYPNNIAANNRDVKEMTTKKTIREGKKCKPAKVMRQEAQIIKENYAHWKRKKGDRNFFNCDK